MKNQKNVPITILRNIFSIIIQNISIAIIKITIYIVKKFKQSYKNKNPNNQKNFWNTFIIAIICNILMHYITF